MWDWIAGLGDKWDITGFINLKNNVMKNETPIDANNVLAGRCSFVMFKISGGIKQVEFELKAMSDHHAILVANDFHYRNGLIGRYYCETSNGKTFSVS